MKTLVFALVGSLAVTLSGGERMSATGDYRLPEKAYVVADTPGYNSWPMIQAMGTKLVCSYSRDNARPKDGHTINPGSRDSYARVSSDGGRTWSSEVTVAADPKVGEVNEGIGLDSTGAALLWVRCWGKGRRHELYRTTDGVTLEKLATITPDPFPMQVMDPVAVEGLGLVSPWFAGSYKKGGSNSWGLLVSADDGRSWTQRVVEDGLSVKEWVTEPSLVSLGNGRLLIVGRCEQNLGNQFQVTSTDNGKTWKKARTNIGDVRESTPSLVYDRTTGLLANYYYHRGARKLKRRVVAADFIFDRPTSWPEPEVLDIGYETRPHDAGNVKATRLGDTDCCAWYSGTPSNSTVVVTVVPKPVPAKRELVNADFEQVDEKGKCVGWYLPTKFRQEKGVGSNGSGGLSYFNDDDTYRDYASQGVTIEPGATYRFGAWVKAEDVTGKGPCFVCLGFRDKDGKYLGESRTGDVRKSTNGEWVKLEGLSKPAPAGAVKGSVSFCVQNTLHGRFFFDKAFFETFVREPVAGVYTSAYRNEAHAGDVDFAAALTPDAFGCPAKDVKAIFAVRGPDGSAFAVDGTMPSPDEARVTIPVARFAVGTNEVVCALEAGDRTIGRARLTFVRLAAPSVRKVTFDRYGRTILNGKPFFPYGMYTGRTFFEGSNFTRYCEAPFNCFMEYGHPTAKELDVCAMAGVYSIQNIAAWYTQPDRGTNSVARAMRVKDHPALLGWYMFDEQPTSLVPVLRDRLHYVHANDPHHPVWCAQDIWSETRHFIPACDVFGADPYPISTRPVSEVTAAMRQETKGLMGMRPIWQVVQFFGWNWHDPKQAHQRRPSEAELRNMTWQAIAGGARGIIYYAYGYLCGRDELAGEKVSDLWDGMKRVANEVKRHERVLLFAEAEAVPAGDLPAGVVGRIFRENGEAWKLLVNTTTSAVPSLGLGPLGVAMMLLQ